MTDALKLAIEQFVERKRPTRAARAWRDDFAHIVAAVISPMDFDAEMTFVGRRHCTINRLIFERRIETDNRQRRVLAAFEHFVDPQPHPLHTKNHDAPLTQRRRPLNRNIASFTPKASAIVPKGTGHKATRLAS